MKIIAFFLFVFTAFLAQSATTIDTLVIVRKTNTEPAFIPDGSSCVYLGNACYSTSIFFDSFSEGKMIEDPTEIKSICVNMEHSFPGDLSIKVICPNGQSATLMKYNGYSAVNGISTSPPYNGGNDLGFSNKSDSGCIPDQNLPGIGWNYCWSEIYTGNRKGNLGGFTRPFNEAGHSNPSPIDSTDYKNKEGFFTPDTPFSNLVGCPVNGEWKLEVCDYWQSDNGWVFSWGLELETSCYLPEKVMVENVTHNSAIVRFGNEGKRLIAIQYKQSRQKHWATITSSENFVSLMNLQKGTYHDVRGLCAGSEDNPIATDVVTFYTPLGLITNFSENFDSVKFIPEGPNCSQNPSYMESVFFDQFPEGATIEALEDISALCINMEHSNANDLDILLTCPNGKKVQLLTYKGIENKNAGVYLGQPNLQENTCMPENNPKGSGWRYCWSEYYTDKTQMDMNPFERGSPIDSSDYAMKQKFFIPDTSFSNLIGCPLNGEWALQISDHLAVDNGWVFNWHLELNTQCELPLGYICEPDTNSITVNFDLKNPGKPFVLQYRVKNTMAWESVIISDTSYTIEGLVSNTTYEVRNLCIFERKDFVSFATDVTTKGLLPKPEPEPDPIVGIANNYLSDKILQIYPNPTKDDILIKTAEIKGNIDVEVRDAKGVLVKHEVLNCGEMASKLALSHLPKGVYFLQFRHDNWVEVKKVVLQ